MRRLLEIVVLPLIGGIISSLIANWIAGRWGYLGTGSRWSISAAIGIMTIIVIAIVFHARKRSEEHESSKIASGLRGGKNVRLKGIQVESSARQGDVASDISAKDGDIDISDVKVKQGFVQDDASHKN